MNLFWSEQQLNLYEQALTFAKSLNYDAVPTDKFPSEKWRKCGAFGVFGLRIPQTLGGMGCDTLTTIKVLEALGKGCDDTGLLFSAAAHSFGCSISIMQHGQSWQKQNYLPLLAQGKLIAAITDLFVVYATTDAKLGYLGQTAFLVPRDTVGLNIMPPYKKMGLDTALLSQIQLDDCVLPERYVLGQVGQGARIVSNAMAWERCCLFAIFIGVMERDIERCICYANERKQRGKPISQYQAISHRIAEMKRRLESARWLLYSAGWEKDQNQDATLAISLAKLAVSEAAVKSGLDRIRIHGGLGYLQEKGIDRSLRDSVGAILFSGTSDIQRELICNRLGLK